MTNPELIDELTQQLKAMTDKYTSLKATALSVVKAFDQPDYQVWDDALNRLEHVLKE